MENLEEKDGSLITKGKSPGESFGERIRRMEEVRASQRNAFEQIKGGNGDGKHAGEWRERQPADPGIAATEHTPKPCGRPRKVRDKETIDRIPKRRGRPLTRDREAIAAKKQASRDLRKLKQALKALKALQVCGRRISRKEARNLKMLGAAQVKAQELALMRAKLDRQVEAAILDIQGLAAKIQKDGSTANMPIQKERTPAKENAAANPRADVEAREDQNAPDIIGTVGPDRETKAGSDRGEGDPDTVGDTLNLDEKKTIGQAPGGNLIEDELHITKKPTDITSNHKVGVSGAVANEDRARHREMLLTGANEAQTLSVAVATVEQLLTGVLQARTLKVFCDERIAHTITLPEPVTNSAVSEPVANKTAGEAEFKTESKAASQAVTNETAHETQVSAVFCRDGSLDDNGRDRETAEPVLNQDAGRPSSESDAAKAANEKGASIAKKRGIAPGIIGIPWSSPSKEPRRDAPQQVTAGPVKHIPKPETGPIVNAATHRVVIPPTPEIDHPKQGEKSLTVIAIKGPSLHGDELSSLSAKLETALPGCRGSYIHYWDGGDCKSRRYENLIFLGGVWLRSSIASLLTGREFDCFSYENHSGTAPWANSNLYGAICQIGRRRSR